MQTMALRLKQGLAVALGALNDKNDRGGAAKLAAGLGISQPAISQWSAIPVKHVLAVEALTGVSREVLRPDHYGVAPRHLRKRAA